MLLLLARALAVACRGHHELVLENIALRQQLTALKRSVARPRLRPRDRLFWIVLAAIWTRWRSALMFVQPDTVVRWHREWFSLALDATIAIRPRGATANDRRQDASLVRDMAAANPLLGAPRIHGELRTLVQPTTRRVCYRQPIAGTRGSRVWKTAGQADRLNGHEGVRASRCSRRQPAV